MRKKFLATTAAIALLASPAAAVEQVGDGFQLNGHITTTNGIPAPTTTTCTLVAGSTDVAGQCAATATSGVAVTFGKAFLTTPSCVVQDRTTFSGNQFATPVSTTGFVMGTTVSGDVINWICFGKQGN